MKSKVSMYGLIAVLNIVIIVSFFALSLYEHGHLQQRRILMYSIKEVQIKITNAHLWLEEYLHGDKKEFYKIDLNLDRSLEILNILIDGGNIEGFDYNEQNNNPILKKRLMEIKELILQLKNAKNIRLQEKNIVASDVIFDLKNDSFFEKLDKLNRDSVEMFKKDYTVYEHIKYILYSCVLLFVLIGLYLINMYKKEIYEKTQILYIDELTKVKNLKAFKEDIAFLFKRYHRYKSHFCIIMLDIDNFKYINDTYGHDMGDKVLIELANIVKSNIRDDLDRLFRVGGEEFVLLCSDISLKDGIKLAEKLRNCIKKDLKILKNHIVTVSFGVSEVNDQDNVEAIYKRVDKNLYFSKQNGKDRVAGDR